MGVDPNNIEINWSSSVAGTSSTTNNVASSTGTTQNPLITSCIEGSIQLISHEVYTENGTNHK